MTNNLPDFKCNLLESLTEVALDEEKETYSNKLESFETYSKRKITTAQKLDTEFVGRLTHGAQLVREHFLQLGENDDK